MYNQIDLALGAVSSSESILLSSTQWIYFKRHDKIESKWIWNASPYYIMQYAANLIKI